MLTKFQFAKGAILGRIAHILEQCFSTQDTEKQARWHKLSSTNWQREILVVGLQLAHGSNQNI